VSIHLCFVCSGNTCRSPMAALVFREHLRRTGLSAQVQVSSAGTGPWHVGEPADPRARAVLAANGYGRHSDEHMAAEIGAGQLTADLFLAAAAEHVSVLVHKIDDPGRVRLLREFDPAAPAGAEIADPYRGTTAEDEQVLAMVEGAMPGLLDWVRERL
jgi:protein-tyrosine phosphatase